MNVPGQQGADLAGTARENDSERARTHGANVPHGGPLTPQQFAHPNAGGERRQRRDSRFASSVSTCSGCRDFLDTRESATLGSSRKPRTHDSRVGALGYSPPASQSSGQVLGIYVDGCGSFRDFVFRAVVDGRG
jgi:hypothetical protein